MVLSQVTTWLRYGGTEGAMLLNFLSTISFFLVHEFLYFRYNFFYAAPLACFQLAYTFLLSLLLSSAGEIKRLPLEGVLKLAGINAAYCYFCLLLFAF